MEITPVVIFDYRKELKKNEVKFRGGQLYISPTLATDSESTQSLIQIVQGSGVRWLTEVNHFAADPNDPYTGYRVKYRGVLKNGLTVIGKESTLYNNWEGDNLNELAFADLLVEPIKQACKPEILAEREIPDHLKISYGSERPLGAIHFSSGPFYRRARREILLFEWINGKSVNGLELVHNLKGEFFGYSASFLYSLASSAATDVVRDLAAMNIDWVDPGVHQTITTINGNNIKVNIVDFTGFMFFENQFKR